MKTTLEISEPIMRRLKEEAARSGKTMSELVETGIRMVVDKVGKKPRKKLRLPPARDMGEALVDIADRDALYDLMERDD